MNYNTRRNNNNKVLKTFKDYLVPIVIVFVILLLVINNLFSSEETTTNTATNVALDVSLWVPDTEAYIVYSWWNKTKLDGKVAMYKTEKLQVVNWSLNIKDKDNNLSLNKLWELRYNEDWGYTLYSSDLWVKTNSWINIEMRYGKVSSNTNSVFSLSQNEVASTVYVVSWIVQIQNLAWKTATLQKWEKLVIMRNNANDENSDLSLSKEQIDDYIKTDDWFVKNNWSYYLSSSTTSTWTTSSWSLANSWIVSTWSVSLWASNLGSYISFNNLYDEMEVNSKTIDIDWSILSDLVFRIELNGKETTINNTSKTFSLKWLKLDSKTNDLVYRVYDDWNKLLYKWVITVYSTNLSDSNSNSPSSTLAQVENYPITSSPLYQILSPKVNPYTTTEDVVRIEWTVPSWTVEKIIVNDFELKKFPKYWSYWSYFANSDFGNLMQWVNIYKIQYFGAEGKLIYENNFTIIKEVKKAEASTWTLETTTGSNTETSTWTLQ